MPVQVIWDDEARTCLRHIYIGNLTIDDYINAVNEVEQMSKSVSHTVHSIMDRSQVLTTPAVMLPVMRYANKHVPPNLGLRVIIKGGMFTRAIVDLGRRVAPRLAQNIYFANDLDDARAIIAAHADKVEKAS